MIDPNLYKQCSRLVHVRIESEPSPVSVESLIESELKKLSEHVKDDRNRSDISNEKLEKEKNDAENDEGFCDKASIITDPSSPESLEEF